MNKPVVHYEIAHNNKIAVGDLAIIVPIDHPSGFVSNTTWSVTSEVIKYSEEDHLFETMNTVYQGVLKA